MAKIPQTRFWKDVERGIAETDYSWFDRNRQPDAPPVLVPQSCKICGRASDSQVCPQAACQLEFYSAEYQEWPEEESEEQSEWEP